MLEEAKNNDGMMDWVGRKHSYKIYSVSLLGSPIFDPIKLGSHSIVNTVARVQPPTARPLTVLHQSLL